MEHMEPPSLCEAADSVNARVGLQRANWNGLHVVDDNDDKLSTLLQSVTYRLCI